MPGRHCPQTCTQQSCLLRSQPPKKQLSTVSSNVKEQAPWPQKRQLSRGLQGLDYPSRLPSISNSTSRPRQDPSPPWHPRPSWPPPLLLGWPLPVPPRSARPATPERAHRAWCGNPPALRRRTTRPPPLLGKLLPCPRIRSLPRASTAAMCWPFGTSAPVELRWFRPWMPRLHPPSRRTSARGDRASIFLIPTDRLLPLPPFPW
mmetsp:Transcript_11415/g.24718  ORF Transcript_11415/g.24718 Transcript_11415/m.24718 type:complete len:204 (+) Transcript_11415:100-711(+)